jgi:hypothetical protein
LPLGVDLLGGPADTAAVTPAAANQAALQALRQWLTHRFNWRPA